MNSHAGTELSAVAVGHRLPTTEIDIDHTTVVMTAATTAAFFRGHTDATYAQRQSRRDIYLATGAINGFVDRYVTEWAGPEAFLAKRTVSMKDSVCAGDHVTIVGEVVDRREGISADRPGGGPVIDVQVTITNQLDQVCVIATLTLLCEGLKRAGTPVVQPRGPE